jgi:hypothetical protein
MLRDKISNCFEEGDFTEAGSLIFKIAPKATVIENKEYWGLLLLKP